MSTDPDRADLGDRPVAAGVRALFVVAIVGGLVAAGFAAVAVKTSLVNADRSSFESGMSLTMPSFTPEPDSLQPIVLPSVTPSASDEPTDAPGDSPSSYPTISLPPGSATYAINLQAGERTVTDLLDLSGTYARGEGSVLQIQQYVDGAWVDFAPPGQTGQLVVGGGLFSGSITPTGSGPELFRVRNISNTDVSNPVSVTVGP